MFGNKRNLTFFAVSFCVLALATVAFNFSTNTSSGTTLDEEYKQQVRNGLAEINLPSSTDSNLINAASDSLAGFMSYRSGIQISQVNKNLLAGKEQSAISQSKGITPSQLSQILTQIAGERISSLTDSEISNATENLRGFNSPDLPASFQLGRSNVKLRANGEGVMTATRFQTEVTGIRDGGLNKFVRSAISSRIALEVERKVNLLRDSGSPEFAQAKSKLSPMQALLITYSIVTDDPLTYNQAGLQQKMQNLKQGLSQVTGQTYSSPTSQKAFGDNGYLFSSPSGLILNESAVTRFLNLVSEQGGI